MPDVEKVIEGLEMSYKYSNVDENNTLVPQWIVLHAIALLKEDERVIKYQSDHLDALLKAQEPVKPIMHYVPDGKRSSAAWQCGNCLIDIGYGANYCYSCGRKVKWDD